jgi:type IX secretion system PorP/SprF family membrane protein
MHLKSFMPDIKKGLIVLLIAFAFNLTNAQQAPLYPISYRIFNPFIFNPAISGSKDFLSVDLMASKYGESNSEIVGGHMRLSKPANGYISSSASPKFTNIGLGGFVFHEFNGTSRNVGLSFSGAYHLKLDKNALSFLSFGVSAKGIYNSFSGNTDLGKPSKDTFLPNFDAGVYYYSSKLFAGISATNLLGNPGKADSLGIYDIPVSRQLFLQLGYKFVLSKPLNIVLEPSLILNSDFSFSGEINDMLQPALKLYVGNFCLGTYFYDFNKASIFFQFQYNKFYIGTYFALPSNMPYYKSPLLTEFTFGINMSAIKSGVSRFNHW